MLTHLGRVTHICVSKLTIIGSDNGLSPDRRQAIIWTNAGILLIGPLGTNFSEILIEILKFSFKKMRFKMSSGKWRPFWIGLNVLKLWKLNPPQSDPEYVPGEWGYCLSFVLNFVLFDEPFWRLLSCQVLCKMSLMGTFGNFQFYCPVYGAFDLGLAVSVPLPIVTGIFVLLWFQSHLT